MKKYIFGTLLLAAITSQAHVCDSKVENEYKIRLKTKEVEFIQMDEATQKSASKSLEQNSTELNKNQVKRAVKAINQKETIVYIAQFELEDGLALSLLLVNDQTCKIKKEILYYAE